MQARRPSALVVFLASSLVTSSLLAAACGVEEADDGLPFNRPLAGRDAGAGGTAGRDGTLGTPTPSDEAGAACSQVAQAALDGTTTLACENGGNAACAGRGPSSADCTHCCSPLTCGQMVDALNDNARKQSSDKNYAALGCYAAESDCKSGRSLPSSDCASCCVEVSKREPQPPGFLLPFACNSSVTVSQGNNSPFSHGAGTKEQYAFDFALPVNTPMLAANAGKVIIVKDDVRPGDPCYVNGYGKSTCYNQHNYVTIDHGDGTGTSYNHLNAAKVVVGQMVERGQLIGLSGGTGFSDGPHAHVQRQTNCGLYYCQSVPMKFIDVPGSGVPASLQVVKSKNGC